MISSLQSSGDWKTSMSQLSVGDLVFTNPGHVGIYVGDGIVMENIGYIARTPLSEWLSWYNVAPRWGWIGGVVLY
jgi:cell wall-associated NlpC family hydrolase